MKTLFTIPLICLYSTLYSAESAAEFKHCYDFGCQSIQVISFTQQQWVQLTKLFHTDADNAWEEKQQIRKAIALMESYAGELTGTYQDRGGNYHGVNIPKQQDCIDESTNTTQYLTALEKRGILKWHSVAVRQRRIVWFAMHWTAVIRQHDNNQLFAVDSWYRDNGEPPYLQRLSEWKSRKNFPNNLNPEL